MSLRVRPTRHHHIFLCNCRLVMFHQLQFTSLRICFTQFYLRHEAGSVEFSNV